MKYNYCHNVQIIDAVELSNDSVTTMEIVMRVYKVSIIIVFTCTQTLLPKQYWCCVVVPVYCHKSNAQS